MNIEKERNVVHHDNIEMVLTTRAKKREKVSRHKSCFDTAKKKNWKQLESQSETKHLETIRGDFLGIISSKTGSNPGYCIIVS